MAGSNASVNATLGGVIGLYLAEDKTLATVPVTTMLVGMAVATMPASLFMRRVGRRTGFMTGAVIAVRMAPGQTQLTRILCRAYSSAAVLVSPITPCLLAT